MVESHHSLEEVFKGFTGGKSEMTSKEFAKLAKDCGLLCKKYTTTDTDIDFSKVKTKLTKVITFDQFVEALHLAAAKKGSEYDSLVTLIESKGGPTFHGTKTENVKLHDDKTTYTGVYARGGPTNVDTKTGTHDISNLCDRTASDARGIKKK